MSFPGVKLKKTVTRDQSAKAPDVVLCKSSDDYHRLMEETYMEKFYSWIAPFSFGSTFVPLSLAAAQALIDAYNSHSFKLTPETDKSHVLWLLKEAIEQAQGEKGWKYMFVRLSSRSPKDAALSRPKFREMLNEELKNLEREERDVTDSSDENRRLQALYRASTYALRTENGLDAVNLLIESERIQGDLKEYASQERKAEFNVVVREFRTFDVQYEFRGFIYGRKMTALTQYNEFCYFPFLKQKKDAVAKKILHDFEKMIKVIELDNYVVDFVLCPHKEGDPLSPAPAVTAEAKDAVSEADPYSHLKVFIVELNPFAEFAGSGLFSWIDDKQLLLGNRPFEFRIVERPPPFAQAVANMTPEFVDFVRPKKKADREVAAS